MNETARNVGVLLAAVLVATMMFAVPAMADAPTVDNETANTSTTSELQDGTTIDNFTADSETNSTLGTYDDENNSRVVEVVDDGDVLETLNSDSTYLSENTSNVTRYFYNRTISHDAFEYAEVTADETHDVTLNIYNTSSLTDNSTENNITVTLNASDGRTVRRIDGNDSGLEFEPLGLAASVPFVGEEDDTDVSKEGLGVSGDSTDVILSINDADAQDNLSSAVDAADSGQWAPGATATVDGDPVLLFNGEAASGVSDSDTYAVYDTDSNDVTFNLGDGYSDADSVDVGIESDDIGFNEARGIEGVGVLDALSAGFGEGGVEFEG